MSIPDPRLQELELTTDETGQAVLLLTTASGREYRLFRHATPRPRWYEIWPNPFPERDRYPLCVGTLKTLFQAALDAENARGQS